MAGIGYALGFMAAMTPAEKAMIKSIKQIRGTKKQCKAVQKYDADAIQKKYDQYLKQMLKRRTR